jgi:hypothetical protein
MSLLRPWQLVSVLALGMALLVVVLNWPDRRSAWDQAAPQRAEGPAARWGAAQCDINRQIQAVERRHGKPVDPESALGRPPFCRDLAFVRQRQP